MVIARITKEIEVTSANEGEILAGEYARRYSRHNLSIGDTIRFVDNGRPKQQEFLGDDHIGKPGIVIALGSKTDIKVMALGVSGDFVEVWTLESLVEVEVGTLESLLVERGA